MIDNKILSLCNKHTINVIGTYKYNTKPWCFGHFRNNELINYNLCNTQISVYFPCSTAHCISVLFPAAFFYPSPYNRNNENRAAEQCKYPSKIFMKLLWTLRTRPFERKLLTAKLWRVPLLISSSANAICQTLLLYYFNTSCSEIFFLASDLTLKPEDQHNSQAAGVLKRKSAMLMLKYIFQ